MESLREHFDVLLTLFGGMLTLVGALLLLLGKSWFRNWTETVAQMTKAIEKVSDNQDRLTITINILKKEIDERFHCLEKDFHTLRGEHNAIMRKCEARDEIPHV